VPEEEPVTAGMFLVNQHPAVVLFDSGSSHSFISQAFARKHNQEISDLNYGYRISSAGANISTRQMVHAVTIQIGNMRFLTNLIVLPGLGLDVIMGMSWMQRWGVIIETTDKTLTLSEP
jgi:predicted aspartyl protease